ncbi:MAG TPA: TetR/AcrR family transcriptional regulator [Acidimicrobiales bacterium]|jgi:AcrR family transcriptional regulator|nr:TetR/AcrR family transcriptional regulator [Acidimicrobiales bacterium]
MVVEPIRDRRSERHEATRTEILQAAWQLVRAEGLAGLSLRELAHKVGMRAPSLYSYFDSKNAIYDAMYAQGSRAYLEEERGWLVTGDPLADLKAGLRSFVVFCTRDPARYQLLFQRTIPGFEPSAESFAIAVEGLEALRMRLDAIGLTDPEALDLLTAIGTGLTDQQISNDPGGDRWTRLIDEAVEMFYDHVSKRSTKRRNHA